MLSLDKFFWTQACHSDKQMCNAMQEASKPFNQKNSWYSGFTSNSFTAMTELSPETLYQRES